MTKFIKAIFFDLTGRIEKMLEKLASPEISKEIDPAFLQETERLLLELKNENAALGSAADRFNKAKSTYDDNSGELRVDSIKFNFEYARLSNAAKTDKSDSLNLLHSIALEKYKSAVNRLEIMRENIRKANSQQSVNSLRVWLFAVLIIVSFIIIGRIFWSLGGEHDKIKYEQRTYKNCQSCARYFSPMLLHGKEKDGTVNKGFCNECYNDCEFLNLELTEQDVIDEIKKANPKMKKVEKRTSELTRWNKNPYVDNYKF